MFKSLIKRPIRLNVPYCAIERTYQSLLHCFEWRPIVLKSHIPFYKSKVAIRVNFISPKQAFFWDLKANHTTCYSAEIFHISKVAIRSNFIHTYDILGLAISKVLYTMLCSRSIIHCLIFRQCNINSLKDFVNKFATVSSAKYAKVLFGMFYA